MKMTFRPLLPWTDAVTPAAQRRSRWAFKALWGSTIELLDRELQHLKAERVVIEADFREVDIRRDGLPKGNAREPQFPGVRIAFDSMHGPLIYQTDTCEYWQHNVRSIALGMEALRAVNRYGVSSRAQQYEGYRQIDAGPSTNGVVFGSADEALRWLQTGEASGLEGGYPRDEDLQGMSLKALLRRVAWNTHPDRGGDPAIWAKFTEARKLVLENASMV